MAKQKKSLTFQIMIAMGVGALLGILINLLFKESVFIQNFFVDGVFHIVGAIFVASLKMMVVPLVFVSLVGGVTSLGDISSLGRISLKSLALYLTTTAVAVTLALGLAAVVGPGQGFEAGTETFTFQAKEAPPLGQVLVEMVPANPFRAMSEGRMLQVIVFALLFGIAVTLSGKKGQHVLNFFNDLNVVIGHMVDIIMKLAPVGVFALIARTFATEGLDIILPLAGYFLVVASALLIHAAFSYGLLLRLVGGLNPLSFFYKMRSVQLFAFSTASSNATIPVNLKNVKERLGADNSIASFTIPLGATINMDGTAIMQGVATVFIANVYGIDLGVSEFLTVILTATLASIGTAGVPGVGLVMLAMVLGQVGLPVEGIALIIGVDRLLDMMRTAVNVTGDAAVTCIVAKSEKRLNIETFNNRRAVFRLEPEANSQ
ncbi:MAG: dicarboxylate/amino acid:cation symporter [Pseudomonadota bacterium]